MRHVGRDVREPDPGRRLLEGVLVAAGIHRLPYRGQEHAEGGRPALPLLGALPGRVAGHRAVRLRRQRGRGDLLRASINRKTARVLDCLKRLGAHTPEPLRLPGDRGAAGRPRADRRGRADAVRPRHLRDAGRLPTGAARRGRVPRADDGREHRRRGRPADPGADRPRRAAVCCSPGRPPRSVPHDRRGRPPRRPALWMVYRPWARWSACSTPSCRRSRATASSCRGVGLSCSVAIICGTRRNKPDAVWAWCLFAIGQFLFAMGDAYTYIYERVRRGRAVPVAGRRHLPVALPGAVRRHLHARPAPKPVRRVGVADRLADPDHRPRPDLVAGADLAGDPRRQPDAAGPDRLDRLPHGRHPAAGRRAAAGGRQRQAAARLLPAVRQHRDAACDRLHLRRDAEQRHLQRPGAARHRLDRATTCSGARRRCTPRCARSRSRCRRRRRGCPGTRLVRAHGRLADRARPAGAARRQAMPASTCW